MHGKKAFIPIRGIPLRAPAAFSKVERVREWAKIGLHSAEKQDERVRKGQRIARRYLLGSSGFILGPSGSGNAREKEAHRDEGSLPNAENFRGERFAL